MTFVTVVTELVFRLLPLVREDYYHPMINGRSLKRMASVQFFVKISANMSSVASWLIDSVPSITLFLK